MGSLIFLRSFVEDFNVASTNPTFRSAVAKVCDGIDFSSDKIFLEYGAGTGAFTKYLLENITENSRIISIESNIRLASYLSRIYDNRLKVIHGRAENVKLILERLKIKKVDYIISGIPFSFLDSYSSQRLLSDTRDILSLDGKFIVYQARDGIEKKLKERFNKVEKRRIYFNIPPLVVFNAH